MPQPKAEVYTREPDGVSGMSVTALADFCGLTQPAITQLLRRIEESDPITNDLPDLLKPFAEKDLRLITNDTQGIKIIPDDVCYAIAEYYAFEARSYKGQKTAQDNYRMAGQPSVGFGYRMAEKYAGIPNDTLSGWAL